MLSRRPNRLDEVKTLSGLLRGLGLCALILVSLFAMAFLPVAAGSGLPKIAMPTMGGT
jgi:hypothetical protein